MTNAEIPDTDPTFEFDAPTGGDDIFSMEEDGADDWFEKRCTSTEGNVLEPTDLTLEEESNDTDPNSEDIHESKATDVAVDPPDAAFEKSYADAHPEEGCEESDMKETADNEEQVEEHRSSIHERYLEQKEEVLRQVKEKQARTAQEQTEATALLAEQLAEQKVAADKAAAEAAEEVKRDAMARAEKAAKGKMAAKKAAAEAERLENEMLEAEIAAARQAAEKLKAETAAAEKLEAEKAAAEKLETEKAAAEKLETERLADEVAAAKKEAAKASQAEETPTRQYWKARFDVPENSRDSLSSNTSGTSDDSEMSDCSRGSKRDRSNVSHTPGRTPGTANKRKSKRSKASDTTPFKLTIPSSPKLSKNRGSRQRSGAKTSEEIELEEIKKKQDRLRKQREDRKRKKTKGTARPSRAVPKSSKPLTEPKEFNFRVDQRSRSHSRADESDNDDDDSNVKLFGEYTSMAECVKSFETKTPRRFRSKSRSNASRSNTPCDKSNGHASLTLPQSPQFMSDKRSRQNHTISTEEREAKLMEEFSKKPFKAQPVSKAVLSVHGACGVTAIDKKPLTEAVSPKFRSDARCESRKHQIQGPESPKPFKASRIGEHLPPAKAVPRLEIKKCVEPKSPELLSARRAAMKPKPAADDEKFVFKAQPIPSAVYKGPKAAAPVAAKELTAPEPFNLVGERLHAKAVAELQTKRAEEEARERESRNFKANPIVHHPTTPRGVRSEKELTQPAPFNLHGDQRHEAFKAEWEQALERELEQERSQFTSFRAAPAEVLVKSPYVPKKSNKALTEISNFSFSTEARSQKRQEFDTEVAQKQRQMEMEKAIEEEENASYAAEEVKRMRSTEMSFKATPIMNYNHPFVPSPAHKALTTPMSPQLRTKVRAHQACPN